ncbi:MAG: lipoprotein [Candidatus Zeuxoniibacter abyssi]|nr:MAG: lipoprotein [Candidatus Persebacteraceae bacterium AB1(2)]
MKPFCCGVLLALLLLSGCGYKAPLELPQSAVDTRRT